MSYVKGKAIRVTESKVFVSDEHQNEYYVGDMKTTHEDGHNFYHFINEVIGFGGEKIMIVCPPSFQHVLKLQIYELFGVLTKQG